MNTLFQAIVWVKGRRVLDDLFYSREDAQAKIDSRVNYWHKEQYVASCDIEQMIEEIN